MKTKILINKITCDANTYIRRRNLDYDKKNDEIRLSIFERKILRRIFGPMRVGGQWRKRCNKESKELYSEPNVVNVIKSSRLRCAVGMDDNELPKEILCTNPGGQGGRGRPKSSEIDGVQEDARSWFAEIGWRMPRVEVAGDVCLKRPRPTQGCRADDDDGDDDNDDDDEQTR